MAAEGAAVYGSAPRAPQLPTQQPRPWQPARRSPAEEAELRRMMEAEYVDETRSSFQPGAAAEHGQPAAVVNLVSQ